MTGRKLLIVSPKFHGYWRSIQGAFQQLGYDVRTHRYDEFPLHRRVMNKVRHELVSAVRGMQQFQSPQTVTKDAVEALRGFRPDIALVIRGDDFLPSFWSAIDDSGARRVLWLYDEIRRMKFDRSALADLSPIATYSRHDQSWLEGQGVRTAHVANAYDPLRELPARQPRSEISFVGARMPNREALMRHLNDQGIPVKLYGRDWSDHPIDKLRTWRLHSLGLPSSRDIPLEQAWGVMRDSLATVNVHGDQDGFTMRTFEASGVGGVQLIDRPDVAEYFVPDEEVLVFTDAGSLTEQAERAVKDQAGMRRLRERGAKRALAEHTFVHRAKVLETLWA